MEYNANDWPLERLAATGKRYSVITTDPPWHFRTWSEKGTGRSASQHYDVQSTQWLIELGPHIRRLATPNCFLYLWTVQTHIPDALDIIRAWGFEFKTVAFTWVKLSRNCPPGEFREHFGMGMHTRANPESVYEAHYATEGTCQECLLGRHGDPDRWSRGERQLIISPVREHSRKPDEIYERIERLSPGPYLELFARPNQKRGPLWTAWGLELETNSEIATKTP